MPKKQEAEEVDQPIMHVGVDTPEGSRDLAVGEQIAKDAGQEAFVQPYELENRELRRRLAELEAKERDAE